MAREISVIDNEIGIVAGAISEYTTFYNAIVDIIDTDIVAAKSKAEDICDGFSKAYIGNRSAVYSKVYSLNGSVYAIQTNAENLLEKVESYIETLKKKLELLNTEKNEASQSV